jgi:gliding motility-associated-like protein
LDGSTVTTNTGGTSTVTDVTLTVGTTTWNGVGPLPTNPPFINTTAPVGPDDPAIGAVIVHAGTPDGVYTIPYTICEVDNEDNCATSYARVTVGDATIDAKDNHFTTPISGSAGGTTTSVIVDDRLNGELLVVGDIDTGTGGKVTLTPGTAPSPTAGSITMNSDGTITVAAGTLAGTYSYPYTICEILNPDNCDNAVAVITVSASTILADNDTFGPFNGHVGTVDATNPVANRNVLTNDRLNNILIDIDDLPDGLLVAPLTDNIIEIVHEATPVRTGVTTVPTLNRETGVVSVPTGTPAGQYQITYRICEALNPTNCDDAIVTILVEAAPILANPETYSGINGKQGTAGTPSLASVVENDTFNTTPLPVSAVTLKPGASPHPGITMNSAGVITVAANTPVGKYEYPYTICEILNPTNCSSTLATINVTAATFDLVTDTFTGINGSNGGTTISVLDNDKLNGSDIIPEEIKLVPGVAQGPGPDSPTADASAYLVMNADGTITVRPGTPAGTYTYTYTVCEVLNPTNCTTAPTTATITVDPATIQANPDGTYTVNGAAGNLSVGNALTNDRLNGHPVTVGTVKISTPVADTQIFDGVDYVTVTGTVPALDPLTGNIAVPAGTPAGTYRINYEICELLNPGNCASTTIDIIVTASTLVATDNTYGPVKGNVGSTNLGNVIFDDIYNGHVPTSADVIVEIVTPAISIGGGPIPTISTTGTNRGQVTVPVGTPDGIYEIVYRICEVANPTNCSNNAIVTINVSESTLDALDDDFGPFNGLTGGTTTASIFDNDFLNGSLLDPTDVWFPPTIGANSVLTRNSNGTITVKPNTPAGIYTLNYRICEVLNSTTPPSPSSNCDIATVRVTVIAPSIAAVNNNFGTYNGAETTVTGSILANDSFNGAIPVIGTANGQVTISIVNGADPIRTGTSVPTLSPATGLVTVAAGTPAGQYHITYRICDNLNPTNCDDALITITVAAPAIVAVVDNVYPPINGKTGGTMPSSVVENDTLNGDLLNPNDVNSFTPPAKLILRPGTRPHPGISMSSGGIITVAPNTPANTYQYPYTICEGLNPTNCASTVATIVVTAATITAVNDSGTTFNIANGGFGGNTASVVINDQLGSSTPVIDPNTPGYNANLFAGTPSHPQYLTMNPDGTITVRPGTPAGTYTYPYTICEILNPTNCATATATILVGVGDIVANVDGPYAVNGATGNPSVGNALTNDRLNGQPATVSNVTINNIVGATPIGSAPVPVLDPLTGNIFVPPGTPANTYTIVYEICERLNTSNCSLPATITINVAASGLVATDNTFGPVKGSEGSDNLGNVLDNDRINGLVPTVGVDVTILTDPNNDTFDGSLASGTRPVLNIVTGIVSVPVGTPDGEYVITYEICEVLNPDNCATAKITITIGNATMDALDDSYGPINGAEGGITPAHNPVWNNDFLNGELVDPTKTFLSVNTLGLSGYLTLDLTTGRIMVAPNTPAGTYSIRYGICETLNPTNCDWALASVTVTAAPIKAVNDTFGPVNGRPNNPNIGNVLTNDILNGAPAAVGTANGQVTISVVHPATPIRPGENVPVLNTAAGVVSVPALTPQGQYQISYKICEVLNPTNCDDAIVTVIVHEAPIVANDDTYTVVPNGKTGGNMILQQLFDHVLSNDQLNDNNLSIIQLLNGTITLTPGTRPHPNIIMDPDFNTGFVRVMPNTPAGLYAYPYTICETLNPTNCDHAIIYINVPAAPIDAVDDSGTDFDIANGHLGGRTASVLDNDRLNNTGVVPSEIKLTPGTVTGPAPAIGTVADYFAMNADGTITVRPGTPEGTYTYNYRICEILNINRRPDQGGPNCDNAAATIIVGTGVIEANPDGVGGSYTVNGATGNPSVGNALTNDRLNGAPFTLDKVNITSITPATPAYTGAPVPVLNPATGNISVLAGTPADTYTIDYEICEVLNPTNCADARITINVTAAPIVANDNTFGPVKGHIGTLHLGNVLSNDTFNGNVAVPNISDPLVADISKVTLTWNVDKDGTAAPITFSGTETWDLAKIILNPNGAISVEDGLPDGVYTVTYRICDNINVSPTNCDDAKVFITIGSANIDALDDYFTGSINGMVGGTTSPLSVLRNDFLNGTLIADPTDVILTWETPYRVEGQHPALTDASAFIKVVDGNEFISVEPFTPAGDYAVWYKICEVLNPTTNCDRALVIIRVGAAPIKAVNDTFGPVNGHTGGTVDNILDNDILNGAATTVGTANGEVIIHEVHAATPLRPGANVPVLDTSTGAITVPARTPEGEYQITYRICEVLNPTNCDDAIVTVVVHEATIVANDDVYVALPNGMVGSTMALQQLLAPVLSNDTFNGSSLGIAQLLDGTITLTPGTRPHPNIIMESTLTGSLIVLPNTPAGIYAYPYTICEVLNPANCDNAVIYITVPAVDINAVNDNFIPSPINGMTGGKTASVLDNDEFIHVPGIIPILTIKEAVAANQVKLVPGASSAPQYLTMNADGTITVKPGTPEGNYWYDYQICEMLNLNMVTGSNCDNARATIRVIHATINAVVDNFGPINGASGNNNVGNAFTNDTLNGLPFTADLVTATQVDPVVAANTDNPRAVGKVPTFDPATGQVAVPAGTPEDIYTIRYEICEVLNPTNCAQNDIKITVVAAPIVAVPDTYGPIKGHIGTLNLGNVLGNDTFNGLVATQGSGISHVTITDITDATPKYTGALVPYMDATGQVYVPEATPDGVYTINYTICDNINLAPMPTNCSTAAVTITIGNATIDAIDDSNASEPIIGRNGGDTRSVLENDLLNGTLVNKDINGDYLTIWNVILDWNVDLAGAPAPTTGPALGLANIVPQTNGTIKVLPNTPEGTYLVPYRICEVINPTTNCDIAIAKVVVVKANIDAIDDANASYNNVNGKVGATLPSVLTNDLLDYQAILPSYWADVTLTPGTSPLPGKITMKPNSADAQKGEIVVAPETPEGRYVYPYRICEVLNPLNCDDAFAYIDVVAAPIVANDDNYCATPVNAYTGGTLSTSVLANDLLNGVSFSRAEVILEPHTSPHANMSMDNNGVITVGAKTPIGTYRFTYSICEVLNPRNCDTGEAMICVVGAPIVANDDNFGPMNSSSGGTTTTVLHNDRLNGALVIPTDVKIIPLESSDPANIIMAADGTIIVRAGTPEGTYTHKYRICEVWNPNNCDEAIATIIVDAAPVVAGSDDFCTIEGPINGKTGGTTRTTIFANDRLNGLIVIPTAVDLTPLVSTHPNLSINNNGTITVAPGTPKGTYTYTYRICEVNNPTNCAEGIATICVDQVKIDAIYDDFLAIPIVGKIGGTTAKSVLANDLLDGKPLIPTDAILTPLVPSHPGLTMDANGRITVAPETPEGTYTYTYRICEVLNPTNCDEDVAEIKVIMSSIEAIDDVYIDAPINGKNGGKTVTVLKNDRLNGKILDPADVILTPDPSPALGIRMNTDGTITVDPETKAGTYIYRYTICERINPTNCDRADVTILVIAPAIDAIDDYPAEISGYTGGTTTLSVLDNDLLNGVILNPADVTLFPLVAPHVGITMNANGTIAVAPGVPVGTYPYPYRICEVLNPTNCDIAMAFIKVVRAGIIANDDTPDSINGKDGGKTPSVLDNDLLNGASVNPNEVKLNPGTPSHPGLTMHPDGTITIAPETPAGTYLYPYEICEVLNPSNCDNAVATIKVTAAVIDAIDDDYSVTDVIYGRRGGTTAGSVLENDLLNGRLVLPREVTLTPSTTRPHPNIQMNADGTITVAANTPEGTYTYPYTICEVLNPTNCDDAVATIVVLKTEIFALDDVMDIQNTRTGAVSDGTVLTNDQLNNLPLVDGEFTLHPGTPSDPGLTMNPDGTIAVAPGMKPGTYTYPYTICEVLNPTNCASAVATVRVIAPELVIPNIFTPNDDNRNQHFEIVGIEAYDYIELTIVNRWGNVVYKDDRYNNDWSGKDVSEGTYFYIIRAVKEGHSQLYKGYVTIKRY